MQKSVLEKLLDDNVRFDFGGRGTVNHLPMALVALSRMGASDERLMEYFRWWETNRALPRQESGPEIAENWQAHIGNADMFSALSNFFRQHIAGHGSAETISAAFPALSRGVGAAAFHGLIRLAYGIEAHHDGEIAAGLAALCSRYVDLGVDFDRRSSPSVEAALGRLADALNGATFDGRGIIGKMILAASDPRFRGAVSLPPITPGLLGEIAWASIGLYWQTGNFTVLHMVTATHSARILFDRFPELASERALHALWAAVCAAYSSVGAPRLIEVPAKDGFLPWKQLFAEAVRNNDDHVIKMTYTSHCEAEHYGNPLYQSAAARLVAVGTSK